MTDNYALKIYGGDAIEDSVEEFDQLSDAVRYVERATTDDTTGWQMNDGQLRLVDFNPGVEMGAVIHEIEEIND